MESPFMLLPNGWWFLSQIGSTMRKDAGRFKKGTVIGDLYSKLYNLCPKLLKGLEKWDDIAGIAAFPKSASAYRWIAFHSSLSKKDDDAVIIGGKNHRQVADTLNAFKEGALPKEAVAEMTTLGIYQR